MGSTCGHSSLELSTQRLALPACPHAGRARGDSTGDQSWACCMAPTNQHPPQRDLTGVAQQELNNLSPDAASEPTHSKHTAQRTLEVVQSNSWQQWASDIWHLTQLYTWVQSQHHLASSTCTGTGGGTWKEEQSPLPEQDWMKLSVPVLGSHIAATRKIKAVRKKTHCNFWPPGFLPSVLGFEGQWLLAKSVLEIYQEDRNQGTKSKVSEHLSPEKDQILHTLASLADFLLARLGWETSSGTSSVPTQSQSSCWTVLRTPSPKLLLWGSPSHLAKGEGEAYSNLTPHRTNKLEELIEGFMNSLHWHFVLNPDCQRLSPNLLTTQYFTL